MTFGEAKKLIALLDKPDRTRLLSKLMHWAKLEAEKVDTEFRSKWRLNADRETNK